MGAIRKQPEAQIQKAIVAYLRSVLPYSLVAAIPNGSQRTASGRPANAVAGMLSGMPDLMVLLPKGEVIFFEVKSKVGRVSEAQLSVHLAMRPLNHKVAIVRSIDDVRLALDAWDIQTKEKMEKNYGVSSKMDD